MDVKTLRLMRDRRYSRMWWSIFLLGAGAAAGWVAANEGVTLPPWVIVGLLVGMILGRRRHLQAQALKDACEDEQAQRAARVQGQMIATLADATKRLEAANKSAKALLDQEARRFAQQRPKADDGDR
ncbi:hypothetical protein [Aquincola tertiaricarbonis]|uniref:hypothetical protein n=1 Tax=Aquincola tertiaricarbonis TaxID=391953 RepID=UPI000614E13C|nr:hypothetical protein [Aquincola tertiaricarbonis]